MMINEQFVKIVLKETEKERRNKMNVKKRLSAENKEGARCEAKKKYPNNVGVIKEGQTYFALVNETRTKRTKLNVVNEEIETKEE